MEPTDRETSPEPEEAREAQEKPREPEEMPPTILGLPSTKERLYDRLPFTYRQVDWFIKAMIAFIVVALAVGVATGKGI